MKRFWTIPVLTIYLYTITILVMYGYNSYFGIPSSFISISIIDTTVFAYTMIKSIFGLIGLIKWYYWILISLVVALTAFLSYIFFKRPSFIFSWLLFILMISFLYLAVNLGESLAKVQTTFFMATQGCAPSISDSFYFIPTFYDGEAIMVAVDSEKKLKNAFVLKDITERGCVMQMVGFGPITR